MREALRGIVMFVSLVSVFLFYLLGGAMIVAFPAWLVRVNWFYYLPDMRLVPEWVCFLGGAAGMGFLLIFESDERGFIRESLHRTADFVNRLFLDRQNLERRERDVGGVWRVGSREKKR